MILAAGAGAAITAAGAALAWRAARDRYAGALREAARDAMADLMAGEDDGDGQEAREA